MSDFSSPFASERGKQAAEALQAALNRALEHQRAGRFREAEQTYRQILAELPAQPNALLLLGILAVQTGRAHEGARLLEQAVALRPLEAVYHANLGFAYLAAGRDADAHAALSEALSRDANSADVLSNLGMVCHRLGRLEEAERHYRRSLQIAPTHAAAHGNLGMALHQSGRIAEAQACYERAAELDPRNAVFRCNVGSALKDQERLDEALRWYEQALNLDPRCVGALVGRGLAQLTRGDFAAGWEGYEHRVGSPDFNTRNFAQPRWEGGSLTGRTLLVHCEQGLGDTLQFIRALRWLDRQDGRVIVAAPPVLVPLLAQSGFAGIVSQSEPLPPFDLHVPLLSLPLVFRIDAGSIPHDVPYLAADRERIARWRSDLGEYPGLRVGIAWQGDPKFKGDSWRSVRLDRFAPLAAVHGARLVSLQKGPGSEQLEAIAGQWQVLDLGDSLDNGGGAFLDTAAVMMNLDLVVTTDTAIAHLAGALGVPVWVALSRPADWRWLRERGDSPWYPTMRLFRQPVSGDWPSVFESMAQELAQWAESVR